MKFGLPWSKGFIDDLKDKEFRDDFVADRLRTRIALQIRSLREDRGWTQKQLADAAGKKQSVISRIEDPDYEGVGLQTLFEVAAAFDLPLWVDMPEWSEWASRINEISSAQLSRESFNDVISNPKTIESATHNGTLQYMTYLVVDESPRVAASDTFQPDDVADLVPQCPPAFQIAAGRT